MAMNFCPLVCSQPTKEKQWANGEERKERKQPFGDVAATALYGDGPWRWPFTDCATLYDDDKLWDV